MNISNFDDVIDSGVNIDMNTFIIDIETHHVLQLIRRLKSLKTTIDVRDGGRYRVDNSYSQVHLTSTWNEESLDKWLYLYSNVDYVGFIQLEETI